MMTHENKEGEREGERGREKQREDEKERGGSQRARYRDRKQAR